MEVKGEPLRAAWTEPPRIPTLVWPESQPHPSLTFCSPSSCRW